MNYKIIFSDSNIGTHHKRYEKFDNYCFKADNDLDALDRVYEMVNQAEKYCNLKHLLPTDTCVADCLYEEKRGRFRHVLSTCKFKFTFSH